MSEDRDFPKLGQRYIVRLNQVWQEETYVADQADGEICAGERFWSRDDLDECPSFNYEKDDWISIREAVSNRGQLAALKEENEAFRQERKDLIGELHRLALVEQSLKARVEEQSAYILRLRKAIIDATNNAVPLDSGKWAYSIDDSVLQWPDTLKEPANEL